MSVLAALWGASYMFIKVAIDDVSPIIVVWVRLVLAALVLLPIAHSRGALAELRPHLPTILLLSVGPLQMKRRLQGVQPVGIAAATMTAAALLLTPAVPFAWPSDAPGIDTVASLLVLGAGGTGVAFLIFYTLIAEIGPGRATVVAYI